ncbi:MULTISPECIES: hypothetical protein [Phyllobacterium]|jgi:hypothetical protein|uniref:Lipoprotein n=1 Tax=Phyllobacterium sophorae TaxID=1520277 RepID=A0A2P7BDG1_9HYPH|nr:MULTISPECIES: hypothetical protein [Phyllobacterium]PSH64472.1 hypothetical protein CU103_11230 [Phyllobacterium sophorae]UXN64765.1 hypothetical protein N8E89_02730 [Phyllobacterium sp. A18/5-2]
MISRNSMTCAVAILAGLALTACNSSESPIGVTKSDLTTAQGSQTAPAPGTPAPPGAPAGATPNAPASGTVTASGTTQAATPTAPGTLRTAKLRFAPIVGAPIAAATPLSQRLSALAKEKGITLGTAADTDNTHIMKGYFSALPDGNQTTIIYVWDVLDPAGTRLHRIQGQEKVPGGGADPWSSVPPKTMEGIADKAIQGYLSWVSGAKT